MLGQETRERTGVGAVVRRQEQGQGGRYLRDEDVDHAGEVDPIWLLDDVAQELPEQVITPGGEGVQGEVREVEEDRGSWWGQGRIH